MAGTPPANIALWPMYIQQSMRLLRNRTIGTALQGFRSLRNLYLALTLMPPFNIISYSSFLITISNLRNKEPRIGLTPWFLVKGHRLYLVQPISRSAHNHEYDATHTRYRTRHHLRIGSSRKIEARWVLGGMNNFGRRNYAHSKLKTTT